MHRYVIIGGGSVAAEVAAPLRAIGTAVVVTGAGQPPGAIPQPGLTRRRRGGEGIVDLTVAGGRDDVGLEWEDVLVFATTPHETEVAVREWRRLPVEHAGAVSAEMLPAVVLRVLLRGLDAGRVVRAPLAASLRTMSAIRGGGRGHQRGPGARAAPASFWLGALPTAEQPSPREERAVYQLAADLVRAGFAAQVVDDDIASRAAVTSRDSRVAKPGSSHLRLGPDVAAVHLGSGVQGASGTPDACGARPGQPVGCLR